LLVAAGVNEIKFHFDYNNNPMVEEIFKENGIECIQL
jgi:deoxycytidylate deaminase